MGDRIHFSGPKLHPAQGRRGLARLQSAENIARDHDLKARANPRGEKIRAHASELVEAVVVGLAALEIRVDGGEQSVRFPLLERGHGILFARERAEFVARIGAFDILMKAALHRQVEPFLRARLDLGAHAGAVAKDPQKADGLVREGVYRQRADFLALEVGEAVGRIEQQAARLRVERYGDGID